MKGLMVEIYRDSKLGDCTNGGVSSKCNGGVITGDRVKCDVFSPDDNNPEYVIMEKHVNGLYLYAVPKELVGSGKWVMFGGNFLYTSDSRFPSGQPIAIHDRVEEY